MIQLQRILAPVDFSRYSDSALEYACEFARRFGAELHVLHVMQDIVALGPEPGLVMPPTGNFLEEVRRESEAALAKLPPAAQAAGLTIVRELRQGPPFVEIVRYAREREIDLIIMGTHGRSGIAHLLLGSVAEKVVRKAPCPVLTVRHPEHEFVAP